MRHWKNPVPTKIATDARGRHIAGLDGLRGIAVLGVIAFHYSVNQPDVGAMLYAKRLFWYGSYGVDLFFAISGYLITRILLEVKGSDRFFSAFYTRRFLRIVPVYALTVAVVYALGAYVPGFARVTPPIRDLPYYLFFISNWIGAFAPQLPHVQLLEHFWTLAVEGQFYLIWPLCIASIPNARLPRFVLGFALFWLAVRIVIVLVGGPANDIGQRQLFAPDGLLFGSFVAIVAPQLQSPHRRRFVGWVAAIAGATYVLATLGTSPLADVISKTVGYTLLGIACAALVAFVAFAALGGKPVGMLTGHTLTQIGRYSYGICAYHVPVMYVYLALVRPKLWVIFSSNQVIATGMWTIVFLVTYVIARISYHRLESPILALKWNFPYRTRALENPSVHRLTPDGYGAGAKPAE